MSIRSRLWLTVTLLIGLVLSINAAVVFYMELGELNESFERESRAFATLAGPQALRVYGESSRRENDAGLGEKMAAIARGLPNLKAMVLLSPRGSKVLFAYPPGVVAPPVDEAAIRGRFVNRELARFGGEEVLILVLPVQGTPDSPSVLAQFLFSRTVVEKKVHFLALAYLSTLFFVLLLGAFLAERLSRRILKPVEALKEAATGLRDGDLGARARIEGGGEIAELARIFNDMAVRLERHSIDLEARNVELERAYGELQALHEELSNLEKMAAVGRTAAAVSHEIDNPIGIILGTAGMLKKELSGRLDLAEDLALIEAECLRCRRIVRDLLDFARPGGAGSESCVDLAEAVNLVLKGLKHHPEMRDVEFSVSAAEKPFPIRADPDGVKQVVLNLLLNAAKALGGKGTIEVEISGDGGMVELRVLDRGPGIAAENLERIFAPYFTTGGGAGLGLSISKRLVEKAQGRLFAENREGGGSLFRARWPGEE